MKLFAKWLVNALAILAVAYLLPGVEVEGFILALLVALVLAVVNITLRPILIFFTLPITLLTLGLFMFVIDALLLWLVAALIAGFEVSGFLTALFAAILISVLAYVGEKFIEAID